MAAMPSTIQRRIDHDVLVSEDSEGGDEAEVAMRKINARHDRDNRSPGNDTSGGR
jgi:hypothetical protein